jgi:hypothetical protein
MPVIGTKAAASSQGFGEFAQANVAANYIEDVFSTWLYTGNADTQVITNGIDLATEGGLVWAKARSRAGDNHEWRDTVRGGNSRIFSNRTNAASSTPNPYTFNADGYTIGGDGGNTNESGITYVSWTFREQPKFFDVVTFTEPGGGSFSVNHSLGANPGCVIIKSTTTSENWFVYHNGLNGGVNPQNYWLNLNTTGAQNNNGVPWISFPNTTQFTIGGGFLASGQTYVAYLFAHNAGGFGLTGTDNVISCGSWTGNGATLGAEVNLGFEPQWILQKDVTSGTENWAVVDNMRGFSVESPAVDSGDAILFPNTTGAEINRGRINPTATGFIPKELWNTNGDTYIYIAIRRGPMKVPTDGTKVFAPVVYSGSGSTRTLDATIVPDIYMGNTRTPAGGPVGLFVDRLRGNSKYIRTYDTNAETGTPPARDFYNQTGFTLDGTADNVSGRTYVTWFMRRAPNFFDEVCYTGTGSTPGGFNHNLGVTPEMVIVRSRSSSSENWRAWVINYSFSQALSVNSSSASTSGGFGGAGLVPATDTLFYVSASSTPNNMNEAGTTYVAYLFATCPGVSKVGSYTGTGTTQTINCGFTSGARFVLIKRKDSTGDWYVWDSARGIVPGNDPYLLLNSTAAEVTGTDYVDTALTGFEISSTAPAAINASGGTFIFLAIA